MRITESKLRRIIRQVIQETDISRRDFLSNIGKGLAATAGVAAGQALGGGLESPIIDKISKYIDRMSADKYMSEEDVKQIRTPLGMYLAAVRPGMYSYADGFRELRRLIGELNNSLERSGIDTSKLRLDDRNAHLILPDGRSIPRADFDTIHTLKFNSKSQVEKALSSSDPKFYFIDHGKTGESSHTHTVAYFSEDPRFTDILAKFYK